MSEENNNLGDDLKKGAEEAMEKAGEFAEDAKEVVGEFVDDAKETINEITGENKKILAGVLAIFLGWLGVHKFFLGHTKEGIIHIIITIVSCGSAGSIIGIIEGIIYLLKTDEEFYQTYQVNKRPWF